MKRIREPIPENLNVKLSTEQEWKDVLQILEDDEWRWYTTHKPTELLSEYSKGDSKGICTDERKVIGLWDCTKDYISAQSFIDTYSEKIVYEVGDVVVVTEGLGGDPVGTVTEILRVQEDSNVWVKAITKYVVTGWFSLPNGIRPATEDEIKSYKQSQKPVEDKIVVGDYIIGKDGYVPDVVCKVYEIEGEYYKYTYPSGRENKCQLRYIRKATQEEIQKVTSTVKEEKPIVWKVGNQVKIQSKYTITKITDTHIHLESASWPIEEANDHIRRGIWTMIEKEDTSTVKESIPVERKWKVGDRYCNSSKERGGDTNGWYIRQKTNNTYWAETVDGKNKMGKYTYTAKEIDRYIKRGEWILYNPEPIPVTANSSESPIVVGDIVEIKEYGAIIDGEIGTVITVDDRETTMPYEVKIPNKGTWWLTKEQVKKVITNQQSQTKTQNNGKDNQISSRNNQQSTSKQQNNEEVITYFRTNPTVIEGPRISTGEAVTTMCKIKPQVIEK